MGAEGTASRWRQTQCGVQGRNIREVFDRRAAAELEQFFAAGAHHAVIAANGVVEGAGRPFQAGADFFKVLEELRHAIV